MQRVAAVLFDKDGVLVDFHRTWGPAAHNVILSLAEGDDALAAGLAQAVDFDLDTRRFDPKSVFIAGSSVDTLRAWGELLGLAATPALGRKVRDLFTRFGAESVAGPEDLSASLAALAAQRLPMGIATNDDEISARRQAQTLGIAGRMTFVAGSDSGHGAKPGPGMILAFAEHIGVAPERIMMIGDSTHDLHAAQAAGALRVAIGTGPAALADLAPHADHTIETLTDLPPLVERLNAR